MAIRVTGDCQIGLVMTGRPVCARACVCARASVCVRACVRVCVCAGACARMCAFVRVRLAEPEALPN